MVDLSTVCLLLGRITGSVITTLMMGQRNASGQSASNSCTYSLKIGLIRTRFIPSASALSVKLDVDG